ncbi:glycosyltransferase family 2 protein [Bradyrhizobium sp. STM 3562]|uniref:glycosyltransferase family 2 protein n=1 Tax=Bradyrhizobium sp. STM 3562 TaxID=578924 RepID=UPI0038903A5F
MGAQGQKIVVLMATYNGAKHIEEQLQSLASQTHANWELIVSDDGSTDRTIQIVHQFSQAISQRVTVIKGPQQGFWRNFLWLAKQVDQAEGALFAFCDQDDIWLPDKLERAAKWLSNVGQREPGLYFSRTELVDESGKQIGLSPLFRRSPTFQNALVQNIGGGNTMVANRPAMALLAETPKSIKLIAHDWWTYQLVTGAGGRAFYDPVPSLKYRQHRRNLIGSNRGVRARVKRTFAFASGRWKHWNDVNFRALCTVKDLLSPSARSTFDDFSLARRSRLIRRLYLLSRSGVYRQNASETAAMYLGAIFGRI